MPADVCILRTGATTAGKTTLGRRALTSPALMTPLAFSRTIGSCSSIGERNVLSLSLVRRLERHALNAGHLRLCEHEDTNDEVSNRREFRAAAVILIAR